jgi:hypothetical protein
MTVFGDVAPCSLVEVYRRFRGACCLHHQGDDTRDNHHNTRRRKNLKSHKITLISKLYPATSDLQNFILLTLSPRRVIRKEEMTYVRKTDRR